MRIGIVNRAEPAVRFIRGVRDVNAVHGSSLITVAFHTAEEAQEPFVRLADQAVAFSDLAGPVLQRGVPYADGPFMRDALLAAGCQAVWVGWGFLAEDPTFARLCAEAGIVFIGPTAAAMEALGDKISAKKVAQSAAVPTLPWTHRPLESLEHLRSFAREVGYPLILKAAQGGGGRGIRIVREEQELAVALTEVRRESARFLNSDAVYAEAFLERPVHLEVQVVGDLHGEVVTFGIRDCSVQRNNQKIIEQTPPPHVADEVLTALEDAACRMLRQVAYHGAGTVEFLYDRFKDRFYFMEVNTRLQVEHPITEECYGIDLVALQLAVAMGQSIAGFAGRRSRGFSLQARLNAEDPMRGFAPAPGRIRAFAPGGGPGVRIDTGLQTGSLIPEIYDSMIAKIIVSGASRAEALARLRRALEELHIDIDGGTTNKSLLCEIVDHPQFVEGKISTRFVEELCIAAQQRLAAYPHWEVAFVAAAVWEHQKVSAGELAVFAQKMTQMNPPRNMTVARAREVLLSCCGRNFEAQVAAVGHGYYHIAVAGQLIVARLVSLHNHQALLVNGQRFLFHLTERSQLVEVEIAGRLYRFERATGGVVSSPSPAVVIDVAVSKGQHVASGELLLTLEAMKMQTAVRAPYSGRVRQVAISAGTQVVSGTVLIELEKDDGQAARTDDGGECCPLSFERLAAAPAKGPAAARELFDRLAREYIAVFAGWSGVAVSGDLLTRLTALAHDHTELRDELIRVLVRGGRLYVDVEMLFSHQRFYEKGLAKTVDAEEYLVHFFLSGDACETGVRQEVMRRLRRALSHYEGAALSDRAACMKALFYIYASRAARVIKQQLLADSLFWLQECGDMVKRVVPRDDLVPLMDDLVLMEHKDAPVLADTASHTKYLLLDRDYCEVVWRQYDLAFRQLLTRMGTPGDGEAAGLAREAAQIRGQVSAAALRNALECPLDHRGGAVALVAHRYYRDRQVSGQKILCLTEQAFAVVLNFADQGQGCAVVAAAQGDAGARALWDALGAAGTPMTVQAPSEALLLLLDVSQDQHHAAIAAAGRGLRSGACPLTVGIVGKGEEIDYYGNLGEDSGDECSSGALRRVSPTFRRRMRLIRLCAFTLEHIHQDDNLLLLLATSRTDPKDRRLFGFIDIPSCRICMDEDGGIARVAGWDEALWTAVHVMKDWQARQAVRLHMNRLVAAVEDLSLEDMVFVAERYTRFHQMLEDIGLQRFVIYHAPCRTMEREREIIVEVAGGRVAVRAREPLVTPLETIDEYGRKLTSCMGKGALYPYHILHLLTDPASSEDFQGRFAEYDIMDESPGGARAIEVMGRPYGANTANVVFGIITHKFSDLSAPLRRVIILGDPTRDMGSLAEGECKRVIAALDLAEQLRLPVEWLPVSSGARIDWQSGTENLDWTAAVLSRIITFTQRGGEIHVIVAGVNVGAQSYWNAEATMLMHTKGLLIMVGSEGAMLLTGRKALAYAGSVSADSNAAIGGYGKIMGPNGEGQLYVDTLDEAYRLLLSHYRLTYFARRGETDRALVRAPSGDAPGRDICAFPYHDNLGHGFTTVGDIFSSAHNPERKKPFEIRQVMNALMDQDGPVLERFKGMHDAETAVFWESRLGGYGIGLIGIESRPLGRVGPVPSDGPEVWAGGTLFPLASKKIARAINATSASLPLVVLANLSGFDGSPESMRSCQLEWGAEIGRAVTNFSGLLLFVVIARYHGGAYVVFSKRLNPAVKVIALEGAFASVIGGAPASEVVFGRMVLKNTYDDSRIVEAQRAWQTERTLNEQEYQELFRKIYNEHKMAVAQRFEKIHTIDRAHRVGSIDTILAPAQLRPHLIHLIDDYYKGKNATV